MQTHMALDPIEILAALGFDAPQSVERITGGATTAIWRVEHGQQTFALRVFPPSLARRLKYELAAMRRAHAGGIPVPTVHTTGIYRDHPVMLIDWCRGRTLASALETAPWRAWSWGVRFGHLQAAIHSLEYEDDEDWIAWAGAEEHELQGRLRAFEPEHKLIHLDYHVLNVLVDDRCITAVIDWTNAHSGDPRADVARTYTILCVEPLKPSILIPFIRATLWVFVQGWRRGYRQAARHSDVPAVFYAWAGATMVHDLAPRVGRADSWWQPRHLRSIQRWTARWKQRANLPGKPTG